VIEVTDQPHRGCAKFTERFGRDAMRLVNSPLGRELHLRTDRVVAQGLTWDERLIHASAFVLAR